MSKALLISFLVSMVPLIELRGAIPVGVGIFVGNQDQKKFLQDNLALTKSILHIL
jgi:hypothetical protein